MTDFKLQRQLLTRLHSVVCIPHRKRQCRYRHAAGAGA